MATHRIHTPAPGVGGEHSRVGAITFTDGHADVDENVHAAELAYFRNAGYTVESLGDAPAGDEPVSDLPKKSASAAVWRAYAVEQGMTSEEADDLSRDDLIAHYSKETGE